MSGADDDKWWRDTPGYKSRSALAGDPWDDRTWRDTAKTWTPSPRCYASHPPLPLGGGGLVIHGGSCLDPAVIDADVYIGFDRGMRLTSRQYPWTPGYEILFLINDMQAPAKPGHFKKLVHWTADRLTDGLKVHCGCIGGHGRTGTFFAALVRVMLDEPDAIAYVRQHYCKKAVESAAQVAFLAEHFGVKGANPTKSYSGSGSSSGAGSKTGSSDPVDHGKGRLPAAINTGQYADKLLATLRGDTLTPTKAGPTKPGKSRKKAKPGKTELITPVRGVSSIWARNR